MNVLVSPWLQNYTIVKNFNGESNEDATTVSRNDAGEIRKTGGRETSSEYF